MSTLVGAGRCGAWTNGAGAAGACGRGVNASASARGQAGSPPCGAACDECAGGGAECVGTAGGGGANNPDKAEGASWRGAGASSSARFGASKVFTREISSCG